MHENADVVLLRCEEGGKDFGRQQQVRPWRCFRARWSSCGIRFSSIIRYTTKYAQIEKELLAIVFACEKFHQFIYRKQVDVETDHKPLVNIFKKSLNDCPMRLQRMLLCLQQYDLRVTYAKGTELYIADTLSRAYQPSNPNDTLEEDLEIHVILPISGAKLRELQEETQNDPDLQKLKSVIQGSWPQ